jgi:hypothetical protein
MSSCLEPKQHTMAKRRSNKICKISNYKKTFVQNSVTLLALNSEPQVVKGKDYTTIGSPDFCESRHVQKVT